MGLLVGSIGRSNRLRGKSRGVMRSTPSLWCGMISSGNNRVGEGESQRSRQVPLPICGMYVGNYTTERGEEEKDRPRIRELYVPTFPWLVASAPAYAYAMTYRSIG